MLYSIRQIVSDTRVALDHNAEERPLIQLRDSYTLTLDQLIASKIEPAAREVMEAADPLLLAPGRPVRTQLSWERQPGWGMAVLPLPDDCLRLLSVRLSDWSRPARIITDTHPDYRWQSSPFAGVRGNPDRPVAVVTQRPTGWVAELYSSSGGDGVTLLQAQYAAVPLVVDGHVEWPQRLHHDIISRIALHTCCALGTVTQADETNRYERNNSF